MISLYEYVLNDNLKKYLFNDLLLGLRCRMNQQPAVFSGLNESLANFLNCADVVFKIYSYLKNNFNEDYIDKIKEDMVINLDVSECEHILYKKQFGTLSYEQNGK